MIEIVYSYKVSRGTNINHHCCLSFVIILLLLQSNQNKIYRDEKILIAGVALLSLTACQDKIAFVDNAKLLDNYQEKKRHQS